MTEFTVYGRPGCGYCTAATRLLESKGYTFEYIDIFAKGISKTELAEIINQPIRTVPQVMHGPKHVGGYTDLVPYLVEVEAA